MKWKQATFDEKPKVLYDILTDVQFLVARSEHNGEENVSAKVEKKQGERTVVMHAERTMPLPAFAKKLYEPHQSIDITEIWKKTDGEYVGNAEYIPKNRPLKIITETRLRADGDGTLMRIGVSVDANIPLIGRRIEKFVGEQFLGAMSSSFDYLRQHLNKN